MRAPTPLAVALVLAMPGALAAQQPERLTLLEAARMALETHPSVAAAEARRNAAGAGREEATAAWFPDVALDASYTRFEEPMLVIPLHAFDLEQRPVFDRDVVEATLASRWTVFDGGERSGAIGRAAAVEDAAEADLDDARARLLAELTSVYLEVLSLRETVEAHDARVDALGEERDRVLLAVREEKAARVESSRVEAALAAGRADRVAAAESLGVAVRDLGRLIGRRDLGRADLEALSRGLVAPMPAGPVLAPAVPRPSQDSPDLRRARSEVAAAEGVRRAAIGAWFPDLELASGYVERGALDESYTGEWQVGVQLQYMLFAGGARRAAVSRADAERRAAEERLRLVEDETAARIDRARAGVESARTRAEALAAAAEARDDVARVEKVAVDVGAGVVSDYLDALADLFEVRAAEIRARHAILRSEVELARATGDLDLEWLERRLAETR